MESESKLQIVVSAKDEASSALQSIGKTAESTGSSFLNLSGAVAVGEAALQALEAAGRTVINFLEDSIKESAAASGQMAITRQNIINAGLSFDELGPKLAAYSERMQSLGFDNDEVSASMSKLILITGSYSDAVKLNELAMDLSRNKSVTLAAATTSIAQVMQGAGAKALIQYGLNIKDASSAAEVLTDLQAKVKGSTEAFADSAAGKLDIVAVQWADIKKQVGNELQPVMLEFFRIVETGMPIIQGLIAGVADTLQKLAGSVRYVADWFDAITGKYDHYVKSSDDAAKTTDKVSTSFEGIGKATQTAITHAKAIENLGTDYQKMKDEASRALSELSDSFSSEMKSINDSIRSTEREQANLKKAFQQNQTSDAASIADKIVASEKTIADLKTKIAAEADTMKRSQLQAQLVDEQRGYDASLSFRTNNAVAITEAQKRAGETQLERDIEDFTSRRALALQEYQQKQEDLNKQWIEEQQKKKDTIALYTARTAQITQILAQGNEDFKSLADQRIEITKEEVDKEISYFQRLAQAIGTAKGASKSSVNITGIPISPRAAGGPVSPYMPYIVGEEGPELFTPATAGSIVPNGGIGGKATTINISIDNLFGTDDTAARSFADKIARTLNNQLKLRTI